MISGLRVAKRTTDEIQAALDDLDTSFKRYSSINALVADTGFRLQCAELIRQVAEDIFNLSDPTPLFVNRATAILGDTLQLEQTVNTMKAVRRHPGSMPLFFSPTKRVFNITTKQYDLPFAIDLEKVIRNQIQASVFVRHAAEALSRVYVETVLNAIDSAVTGNDHYGFAMRSTKSGDVDNTTLDAGLRRLGDINENTFIAGRYYALFPITQFTGYSNQQQFGPDQLDEIHSTGLIGHYKGAKVIVLRDDYNFYYGKASIPSNRIYLGGSNKGAWLHERNVSALDYQSVDAEKPLLKNGFRIDFGVTVVQPYKYHIIALT